MVFTAQVVTWRLQSMPAKQLFAIPLAASPTSQAEIATIRFSACPPNKKKLRPLACPRQALNITSLLIRIERFSSLKNIFFSVPDEKCNKSSRHSNDQGVQ